MQTMRALRRAKEISQGDMAEKLNIHINTYQNWEKEPQKITIENAHKIADIFGVTIDDISFLPEEVTE